jgi:AcrR family transcriptional regulator
LGAILAVLRTPSVTEEVGLLPPGLDLSGPKRRLYEVALQLFGELGYHAVSMRDIASALSQQPSAIYSYVSSKQELLFELALIGHQNHHDALKEALMDAGRDPHDQVRALVEAHVLVHLDYPSMARLTNRELRSLSEEQAKTVLEIRSRSEQMLIDVIERGIRMGAFQCSDAFLAGKVLGAMGIRLPEWWTSSSPRTREQIIETYTELALKVVS